MIFNSEKLECMLTTDKNKSNEWTFWRLLLINSINLKVHLFASLLWSERRQIFMERRTFVFTFGTLIMLTYWRINNCLFPFLFGWNNNIMTYMLHSYYLLFISPRSNLCSIKHQCMKYFYTGSEYRYQDLGTMLQTSR